MLDPWQLDFEDIAGPASQSSCLASEQSCDVRYAILQLELDEYRAEFNKLYERRVERVELQEVEFVLPSSTTVDPRICCLGLALLWFCEQQHFNAFLSAIRCGLRKLQALCVLHASS